MMKKLSLSAASVVLGTMLSVTPAFASSTTSIVTTSSSTTTVFAQGTNVTYGPDDIALLGNHIYVAYQNGVGSKGEASKTGNKSSTMMEYDMSGHVTNHWTFVGKCDGFTTDAANHRIIATVNEDGNSSMYVINLDAAKGHQVRHVLFNENPTSWGGGTDSVVVVNGHDYVSASAPSANAKGLFTHAGLVDASIHGSKATFKPVLMDNAFATDITTGKPVTLNLSDADTNTVVPSNGGKYAGDIVLDSQGDSELIFIHHPGASQTVSELTLGTQIDGIAWATSSTGTLYVTDGSNNMVYAIHGKFSPGTVFVSCPNDSGVAGFVGTLDLTSGTITPMAIGFNSPKGLLFVPGN